MLDAGRQLKVKAECEAIEKGLIAYGIDPKVAKAAAAAVKEAEEQKSKAKEKRKKDKEKSKEEFRNLF